MTRAGVALSGVLLLVASSVAGCNKAPALEALAEVESSLEASRPTLERYNPEDLRRLDGAVTEARRFLEEGRYTDALRVAQRLPSRIDAALVGALARRDILAADWDEVSGPLPDLLARLRRRVVRLGPPTASEEGAEPAWHARARADMAALDRAWADARDRYEEGDAPGATAAAREVASGARDLGARLGLDLPPRPVPAGDEGEGTAADAPSSPPTPFPLSPDPTVGEE